MTVVRGPLFTLLCVALALSTLYLTPECAPVDDQKSGKKYPEPTVVSTKQKEEADQSHNTVPQEAKRNEETDQSQDVASLTDLTDVFRKLSLDESAVNVIMKSIDEDELGTFLTTMRRNHPELTSDVVAKAWKYRSFVKGLLAGAPKTETAAKSVDVSPSLAATVVETEPVDVQLMMSLQTALSAIPPKELQYVKNEIETGEKFKVMKVLLTIQQHFPKLLTDELMESALKNMKILKNVVDYLLSSQSQTTTKDPPTGQDLSTEVNQKISQGTESPLARKAGEQVGTGNTDPNPQSTQKSASRKASSSEMGEVVKPTEHSTPVNKAADVAPQNSGSDEESEHGGDDATNIFGYGPEFDDGDLPDPNQKGGEQGQTGNNPSIDNTDAGNTNHPSNDNTDAGNTNHPSNDNADAGDINHEGGGDKPPGGGKPIATESTGGWFKSWHFLIIFLVIAGVVAIGYLCTHNRKKIREGIGSYVADARSRQRRTRNFKYRPVRST